jgi:hypothetical protein
LAHACEVPQPAGMSSEWMHWIAPPNSPINRVNRPDAFEEIDCRRIGHHHLSIFFKQARGIRKSLQNLTYDDF